MSEGQGINSVEIAIAVLEVVARHDKSVRAIDIAKEIGFSKSRLHKYLVSLCRCGMLHQDPETTHYALGDKPGMLARAAKKQNTLLGRVNASLCALRDRLNISTGLAVMKNGVISMIKYNRSNKDVDLDYRDNTILPLKQSAAGKIYVAYGFGGRPPANDPDSLRVREQGYALREYEIEGVPGARAIGCPVFNAAGQVVAVVLVKGFLSNEEEELRALALQLMDAVSAANANGQAG